MSYGLSLVSHLRYLSLKTETVTDRQNYCWTRDFIKSNLYGTYFGSYKLIK